MDYGKMDTYEARKEATRDTFGDAQKSWLKEIKKMREMLISGDIRGVVKRIDSLVEEVESDLYAWNDRKSNI